MSVEEVTSGTSFTTPELRKPARSQARIVWENFIRNKLALVGGIVVVLLYLGAIFAPQLAPHDYAALNPGQALKGPSREYPLGTDRQTRDVLSRILVGSRTSLSVGFVAVVILMTIGVLAGAVSGYFGGWVDNVIMRIMDVVLAFPSLILAIAVVTVLGPGLVNALLAISIVSIPAYARVARSGVLAVKEEDFVMADRALGVAPIRILFRRILPNALAPLIVQATLGIGTAILDAAALSFLGLGAQPPTPEWGAMLGAERNQIFTAPHLVFYPGIAIMITVLAFNLLGDGLRDALDPRLDR